MSRLAVRPPLALLAVALAAVVLRLAPAAFVHLTEDEAYYRLWAQHLQWGYYDHPPMIAWWIWLGERIAGDTPLGVRLLPSLAVGAATWLLGDLALALGASAATAIRAGVWYNATLTVALGGFLATPDAPAGLFWILTLWCVARAARGGRLVSWIGAGAAAGLGTLSKYSALFLAPGIGLWMLLDPRQRRNLARPGPWLAAAVAVALFSVNIAWNAQHGWVTFAKQFGRAALEGFDLNYLPEFLLTQFVLLNPFVAYYGLRGAAEALGAARRGEPHPALLPVATSLPFLGYLLLHSLHARVQGHWPAPVYGPLALTAALWAERPAASAAGRLIRRLVPVLSLLVAVLALAHVSRPKVGSLGVSDPALPLVGWSQFAGDLEAARRAAGAGWVGVLSYGLAAQLASEEKIQAPLLQVNERARYTWGGPAPDLSRPGLLIDLDRRMDPTDLSRCFARIEPAGELERGFKAGPVIRYRMFLVSQPRGDLWTNGCHLRKEIVPHF